MTVKDSEFRARGQHRRVCPCCGRCAPLTFHHLIPKKLHRRKRYRADYTREQLAQGVYVCRRCHDGIHDRFDEMTLARNFNSLARLVAEPGLKRHFVWVARQRIQ